MALFSTIGSFFGPVGTGVGMVADYALSKRDARRAQDAKIDQQGLLNEMAIKQEQASILGRVDAAKAAGIHPLVAMGAQGLGGPVVSATGPEFGAPMPPFQDLRPRRPVDTRSADQKRRDAAEADLAELQVQEARRRLSAQPGNGGALQQLTGTGNVVPSEATPHPVSHVRIEGQTLPPSSSAKSFQTPGVAPGWDVVEVGTREGYAGRRPVRMVVPGGSVDRQNWGEQLGELPLWLWPDVIRQSAAASGMTSKEWLWKMTTGKDPLLPRFGTKAPPTYRRGSRSVFGPVD